MSGNEPTAPSPRTEAPVEAASSALGHSRLGSDGARDASEISGLLSLGPSDSSPGGIREPTLRGARSAARALERASQERRMATFMLLRLGLLVVMTVLGGLATWFSVDAEWQPATSSREVLGWIGLAVAYASAAAFAWAMPRVANLDRLAAAQLALDVTIAALAVHVTGGADSGFHFLFLVNILGGAVMGGRRHALVTTLASVGVFSAMCLLQGLGIALPAAPGANVTMSPTELGFVAARTIAAMAGVGILGIYLSIQLGAQSRQIGSLRALHENIVRSLSSGLVTVDVEGRIAYANPIALTLLGTPAGVEGVDLREVLPQALDLLEDSGSDRRREVAFTRADGRSLDLALACGPLVDAEGQMLGYIVDIQDMTELRNLARRLRRSERLAAIGGLAATVAHEIRNPLAAISGCAELLDSLELAAEDRRLVEIVRREARRLDRTVGDLLTFARARAPELVDLALADVVTSVVESFGKDPSAQALQVQAWVPPECRVRGDRDQLAQMLWNLLRNAAEATSWAGLVQIRGRDRGTHVRLTVTDDGPGIPADRLEKVFEPQYTTKPSGSGFGLAVVHRIVEDHGGTIEVDAPPNGGTRFSLTFPRMPSDRPA